MGFLGLRNCMPHFRKVKSHITAILVSSHSVELHCHRMPPFKLWLWKTPLIARVASHCKSHEPSCNIATPKKVPSTSEYSLNDANLFIFGFIRFRVVKMILIPIISISKHLSSLCHDDFFCPISHSKFSLKMA